MRVFKYRGGPKHIQHRDVRSLALNQIYAAEVTSLNDLFEAQVRVNGETFQVGRILAEVGLWKAGDQAKAAGDAVLTQIEQFAAKVKTWGVYSMSRTPTDELLWAYYADSHRGFCLEYELEELLKYGLEGQDSVHVTYQDDVPVIDLADVRDIEKSKDRLIQRFIGTKSRRWGHEGEVRVVTGHPGVFEYDYRALKSVYFGARSARSLRRLVMRVLAGRGISYFLVTPADGRYALRAEPLHDAYPRPATYRKRIAPIADGVPFIDSKLEPYRALVLQAIEIARRDPYCERVVDAYISSRGTVENPVFYVSVDRSDGLPRNIFISKSDIERWRDA